VSGAAPAVSDGETAAQEHSAASESYSEVFEKPATNSSFSRMECSAGSVGAAVTAEGAELAVVAPALGISRACFVRLGLLPVAGAGTWAVEAALGAAGRVFPPVSRARAAAASASIYAGPLGADGGATARE
jgi:isoaspartyl peptidase/L-asparaginase-like protein (Ntn-hydrolase superfamily)